MPPASKDSSLAVQEWLQKARNNHASRHGFELVICDCRQCYGKGIKLKYSTVKRHRTRYGLPSHRNSPPLLNVGLPELDSPAPTSSCSLQEDPQHVRGCSNVSSLNHSESPEHSQFAELDNPGCHRSAGFSAHSPLPSPLHPNLPRRGSDSSGGTPSHIEDLRQLRTLWRLLPVAPRQFEPDPPPPISTDAPTLLLPNPLYGEDIEYYPWPTSDWFLPNAYHRPWSPSLESIATDSAWSSGDLSPIMRPANPKHNDDYYDDLLSEDERLNPPPPLHGDDNSQPFPLEEDPPRHHIEEVDGDEVDDDHRPEAFDIPQVNPAPEDQLPVPDALPGQPPEPEDPEVNDELCAAFREPSELRNLYIRTYLHSVKSGVQNDAIADILASNFSTLLALDERQELDDAIRSHLPTFPKTLRTLQRRLGVDTDSLIKIYALCPDCGTRQDMEFINSADAPECPHIVDGERCGGTLFKESRLHGGIVKRTPNRFFPYVSPIASLERQLLRPGFLETLQLCRNQDEEPGDVPPVRRQDWMEQLPNDQPFGEVWEAWFWKNQPVGLERQFDEETETYGDTPLGDLRSLVWLPLGLSLSINVDGFRAFKKGKYSVQAVYIIINNLPLHLRTQHENMMLAIVMPGPKEPSEYEFNQILQPLVDDLLELGKGKPSQFSVSLLVHSMEINQAEERLVHASLSSLLVDYIARIKCNGHAGTASEQNFCLYCKSHLRDLSISRGFIRDTLELRNPHEYLQHKYAWLHAPLDEREALRETHGTRFTEFDRLPGFFGPSQSPIDGMHLFHLGLTSWIFREVLIEPGMFNVRHRGQLYEDTPLARFNETLQRFYFPSYCGRLPKSSENLNSHTKAEQWKHLGSVAHILCFQAWRVGDGIPDLDIPRGNRNSKTYKDQQRKAAIVCGRRERILEEDAEQNMEEPTLSNCAASRNPRAYYRNILRYCVAVSTLVNRKISRDELAMAQRLLERMSVSFTQMNVHLSPSFHYAMHVEPFVLKYGSLYNTWTYPFERANLQLQTTNNNGHGSGFLETTMCRGFLKRTECYHLLRHMQDIPNPTRDDIQTINALLKAVRGGPEAERQRGMLAAVLTGDAVFRSQERIQLPSIGVNVNLRQEGNNYALLTHFCTTQLPGYVVFGDGRRPPGGVHLAHTGTTRSFSHVLHCGIRYGVANHYRGHRSRYGYILGRIPAIIRKIYEVKIQTPDEEEHKIICAVVQRFQPPCEEVQWQFPWELWAERLGTDFWKYNELGAPEVVNVNAFTGVFAMTDLVMDGRPYWVTRAMHNTVGYEDLD